MFWTNLVKNFCKVILCILIIAVVIVGFVCMKESFLLGLVVIVIGVILSMLTVSGIMLICEISDNVNKIKENMENSGSVNAEKAVATPKVPFGSWACSCGKINKGEFCAECGAKKPQQ